MAVLSLSDDLLKTARQYAENHSLSLDDAIARLISLGLGRAPDEGNASLSQICESPAIRFVDGFGEFSVPPDTPFLSTEDLLRIEDEY